MIEQEKLDKIFALASRLTDGEGEIKIPFKTVAQKDGLMLIEVMASAKQRGWLYDNYSILAAEVDGSHRMFLRSEMQKVVETDCKSRQWVEDEGQLKHGKLIKLNSGQVYAIIGVDKCPQIKTVKHLTSF